MRRLLILAVALVTILGALAPPAMAQAPAPKVTITGLIDNVGTYVRNMSSYDFNLNRSTDNQAYGRTRGRFDIIGEVGKAKGVMGFEIDGYWGQIGFSDSNATGCQASGVGFGTVCGATVSTSGAEGAFDANTDNQGIIQVKWLYTEFPLPLIPLNSVMRLGAQPYGSAALYKSTMYANGDFAGVNLVTDLAPGAKLALTFTQVEENLTGKRDIFPFIPGLTNTVATSTLTSTGAAATGRCAANGDVGAVPCNPSSRGEDWAFIASFEFSPFKGLDIKPMYSFFFANGVTSGAARQGRGGMAIASGISGATGGQTNSPFAPISVAPPNASAGYGATASGAGTGIHESRHTLGVDARFTAGPFSLQPTVLYQFGDRDAVLVGAASSPYGLAGTKRNADIDAWLVDVRASFSLGPLTLSGLVMWTSGDPAHNNPYEHISYFQPLSTDTGYGADWGENIFALGTDYYQILNGGGAQAGLNHGVAIGYDKYGRLVIGGKARYAVTPALDFQLTLTGHWTDKAVDTDGFLVANGGIQPQFINRRTGAGARAEGDHDYLGTELGVLMSYRFAPGVTLDVAGGYLWAGPALNHRHIGGSYVGSGLAGSQPPGPKDIGVNDVMIGTARVRYTF